MSLKYYIYIFFVKCWKKLLTIFIVSSGSCIFKKETLYGVSHMDKADFKKLKKNPCRKKYLEFLVPFRRELSDIIDDAYFSKTVIIWQFGSCWEKNLAETIFKFYTILLKILQIFIVVIHYDNILPRYHQ